MKALSGCILVVLLASVLSYSQCLSLPSLILIADKSKSACDSYLAALGWQFGMVWGSKKNVYRYVYSSNFDYGIECYLDLRPLKPSEGGCVVTYTTVEDDNYYAILAKIKDYKMRKVDAISSVNGDTQTTKTVYVGARFCVSVSFVITKSSSNAPPSLMYDVEVGRKKYTKYANK